MKRKPEWRDKGYEAVQAMLRALHFIKKPDTTVIDARKAWEDHYGKIK